MNFKDLKTWHLKILSKPHF